MKRNKKGFLLGEETLKIILAVIAIGFLVYLLFSLYFSLKDSRDLELAKETLPFLVDEARAGRTSVDIYNPRDWMLTTWPHDIKTGGQIMTGQLPKTCSNLNLQSCICLCKYGSFQGRGEILDLIPNDCDSIGICLDNEGFLVEGEPTLKDSSGATIEIKDPPLTLDIDQTNKKISKGT